MDTYFSKVKEFITELDLMIVKENTESGLFVVENESEGLKNVIIAVSDPIIIIQQHIFDLKEDKIEVLKSLLQKNQDIIHGAFTLDESGKKVMFRDTLQLENLDLNELQGSLQSLSLLMTEYAGKILEFSA
ncbi:MAG: molecular chaperone Tir [Bacteroidota bacterium]|nr:molecular chaperone Tir [Bacteroidota bacterium]